MKFPGGSLPGGCFFQRTVIPESRPLFRSLSPALELQYALVWKQYGTLSRAVERFLREIQALADWFEVLRVDGEDYRRRFDAQSAGELLRSAGLEVEESESGDPEAPIVKLLSSLLDRAVSTGASDIHIEPFEGKTRVRMRIDGTIVDYVTLERSGPHVVLEVSDTGSGITPEFLPHLFEMFRQADSTSKGKTTTGDTSSGSTSSSSTGKETESKSSESSGGSSANSGLPATESKPSGSTSGGASANSGSSASSSGQTAPMPESTLTNDMIVGLWSPDPNAEEPRYIDFHATGDLVTYDYYSLIDSRALGRPQPSAPVRFEFCNGVVDMMLNQGRCSCLTKDSNGVYISFYIDEMANDVIYDQETGTAWHRVIPHVIENH